MSAGVRQERKRTRAERSRINKAAWAQADRQLQAARRKLAVPLGASKQQRAEARKARRAARARRDTAFLEQVAERRASAGSALTQSGAPARRQSAPRRKAKAVAVQAEQAWHAGRGPTLAERRAANRRRWALAQAGLVMQTAQARTSLRGKKRQGRSIAHAVASLRAIEQRTGVETAGLIPQLDPEPTTRSRRGRGRTRR